MIKVFELDGFDFNGCSFVVNEVSSGGGGGGFGGGFGGGWSGGCGGDRGGCGGCGGCGGDRGGMYSIFFMLSVDFFVLNERVKFFYCLNVEIVLICFFYGFVYRIWG